MKKEKKLYFLFYIPLVIIMIISLLNMQNTKLINIIYKNHLIKQIIWYILGFILIFIIKKLNLNKILKYSFWFYLISIILLILVLIFGSNVNGAKAWFNLKFISFQPSELVKLTLPLYLCKIIDNSILNTKKDEFLLIIKVFGLTLIPSILVFLEPDTGAIVFYLLIMSSILLFSNISKWWFLGLLTFGAILIISFYLLYIFNPDILINIIGTSFFYRIERILTFTNNNSYQLNNALIVMGSSTLLGQGLNKTSLYIPESPTDFIFAFNIGNFGLLSGIIILICYLLLDIFFIKLATNIKSKKIKLFIISFISVFFFQQFINIGMNLGLVPIIGIPLPFLSYGGSTLIIYFIYIGLIFNMCRKEKTNYL